MATQQRRRRGPPRSPFTDTIVTDGGPQVAAQVSKRPATVVIGPAC